MQLGVEVIVDTEDVAGLNLLGLGLLEQHTLARLAHGQRLQRSYQVALRNISLALDLLQHQTHSL